MKHTSLSLLNYTEPQSLELSNVYCIKGKENTFVLQNCMLLERNFSNLYKKKSVPNRRIMFPKSKGFDFLDVPTSILFQHYKSFYDYKTMIKRLNAIVAT